MSFPRKESLWNAPVTVDLFPMAATALVGIFSGDIVSGALCFITGSLGTLYLIKSHSIREAKNTERVWKNFT
jgi:hypothetical protein